MPLTILNTGTFNGIAASTGAAAGLPSAAAGALGPSVTGPRVRRVGAALGSGASGDMTISEFLAVTGGSRYAVGHFFYGGSVPASLAAAPQGLAAYAGSHRALIDFELTHYGFSNGTYGAGGTPAAGAVTDLGNLQAFLESCIAGGLDTTVTLWHEPFNKFNLGTQVQNNLDYANSVGYYGAMLRSLGIPVKFGPSNFSANSSYGHWAATIGNAAAPGLGWAACSAGYIDEVVTDIYVNEASSGPPGVQGTLDDAFGLASAFGLPFGMNEYGYAPATGAAYTQDDISAFSSYVLAYFQNLLSTGYPVCDLVAWATNDNAATAGMYLASSWSAATIANYQALFDGFDGGTY